MGQWTPADVIELARLVVEALFIVVGLIGIFTTKADVKATSANVAGMRKDVDGRFSQLVDLVARLSGVPERRDVGQPRASEREPPPASPP